jgi:hypothetical protein
VTVDEWALVYVQLVSGETGKCPACGSATIESRFVGDLDTRIGYGLVWCTTCYAGCQLSRLQLPADMEMRDWNDPTAVAGVPTIKLAE